MLRPPSTLLLAFALACGPAQQEDTLPDESDDLAIGTGGSTQSTHLSGTTPVGPELGGSRWTWVEAYCTEGPLDLASRGFQRTAEVTSDDDGLLFVYDHVFQASGCQETVAQRATPGDNRDAAWAMREESRVTLGECETQPEPDRPGDVRMRGQFLEVYVQRSKWCNGLEVRMVYAPAQPVQRTPDILARHYATHFNRQDARNLTLLFSDAGSLVEPFNLSPTGGPTRHDGRAAIFGWFQEAFSNTPWLAMKVTGLEPGPTPNSVVMDWHYMDPRLDAPFAGRNRFTVAGGEIFETSVEITQTTVEGETASDNAPDATGEVSAPEDADAEAAEEPPADPEAGAE